MMRMTPQGESLKSRDRGSGLRDQALAPKETFHREIANS